MADVKLVGADDATGTGVNIPNYVMLSQAQAIETGTLNSIRVKAGYTGNAMVAIYSNVSGSPSSLLASSGSTALSVGWNTIAIGGSLAITKDAYYWLGYNSDQYCVWYIEETGRPQAYKSATYSGFTWPNPITGYGVDSGYRHFVAAWGTVGGAQSVVPLLVGGQYRRRR